MIDRLAAQFAASLESFRMGMWLWLMERKQPHLAHWVLQRGYELQLALIQLDDVEGVMPMYQWLCIANALDKWESVLNDILEYMLKANVTHKFKDRVHTYLKESRTRSSHILKEDKKPPNLVPNPDISKAS